MTNLDKPDLARFGIFTTAQALAAGHTKGAVRHKLSTGEWLALRRGLYVDATAVATLKLPSLEIAAALGAMHPGAVASHWSAAHLFGIKTLASPSLNWVTRAPTSRNGRHLLPSVIERAASLPSHHVTCVSGLPSTSPARTVVDLARMCSLDAGVVSADSALHLGLTTCEELIAVATECKTWPGGPRALRAVSLADALAESPLESVSRMAFLRMGLPKPELQVQICDSAGVIGRLDFHWRGQRTAGEADGRGKYDKRRERRRGEKAWLGLPGF